MKRLYAIDLDGTLLRRDKTIPYGAKDCFSRIQLSGDVIVFMTGRTYSQTEKYLQMLEVTGVVICNDGKYILEDNGNVIEKGEPLDSDDAKMILESLTGMRYVIAFIGDEEYIIGFNFLSIIVYLFKRFYRKKEIKLVLPSMQEVYLQDVDRYIIGGLNISKIYTNLRGTLGAQYNVYNLTDENKVQISSEKTNKYFALKKVQRMLDVCDDCVYVFGNDGNDELVLSNYKNSYAVSNASDSIKKIASEVIDSNECGGVIAKLKELGE